MRHASFLGVDEVNARRRAFLDLSCKVMFNKGVSGEGRKKHMMAREALKVEHQLQSTELLALQFEMFQLKSKQANEPGAKGPQSDGRRQLAVALTSELGRLFGSGKLVKALGAVFKKALVGRPCNQLRLRQGRNCLSFPTPPGS